MTTEWPLIWTVTPRRFNMTREIGDGLYFNVSAIPDPDFPSRWRAENPNTDETTPPPPLPPKPTDIKYSVISTNIEKKELYNISTSGLTVGVNDVSIFLPFESIRYIKANQEKSVQYIHELENDGYDYVFEMVPSSKPNVIKNIVIKVTSTSKTNLEGDFQFQILNNFDSTRKQLKKVTNNSNSFLGDLVDGHGEVEEAVGKFFKNIATEVKLDIKKSHVEVENKIDLFLGNTNRNSSIDTMFKNNKISEAKSKIGDGEGLLHPVKSSDTPSDVETSLDNNIRNRNIPDDILNKISNNRGNK